MSRLSKNTRTDENTSVTCGSVTFRSEDGRMEERPDRRPMHPAGPGPGPRGGLQEAPPALQEENLCSALRVSGVNGDSEASERLPVLKGMMICCVFGAPTFRKSTGTKVERLSLTQAEANEAANGPDCG